MGKYKYVMKHKNPPADTPSLKNIPKVNTFVITILNLMDCKHNIRIYSNELLSVSNKKFNVEQEWKALVPIFLFFFR